MRKKWLISVREEPDMISTTLDNGRRLRKLIIGVSLFFAFQAIRKSLKYVKFRLTPNQDLLHTCSGITDGDSGIWARDSQNLTLDQLETNLYFVLITIKGILNISFQLKTQGTN